MRSARLVIALMIGAVAWIGGCPFQQSTSRLPGDESTRSGSSDPTTPQTVTHSDTSAAGTTDVRPQVSSRSPQTPAAAADALTASFPGCEDPLESEAWCAEVLRLVNQERASRGAGALAWNTVLEQQAMKYGCELIHYDFFGHINPVTGSTLTDRADEFGYDFSVIGENLAAGQPTPDRAVQDWMASPGHRDNILNPVFTEIGIAVRAGGTYGIYWVQEFGCPATAPALQPNKDREAYTPDPAHVIAAVPQQCAYVR